jgi:hypothetical protein
MKLVMIMELDGKLFHTKKSNCQESDQILINERHSNIVDVQFLEELSVILTIV